jgi:small-conductance mechanosensitive channel
MAVSHATEAKLRQAMQRLLDGRPTRTDGALTKENLAREAGVSHATVHRADTVLADWNTHVPQPITRTASEVRRDHSIDTLRGKLREANQHITTLTGKLDALATVTANLYHENQALRRQLGHHTRLVPLPTPRQAVNTQ